jgi:hypothetical protein
MGWPARPGARGNGICAILEELPKLFRGVGAAGETAGAGNNGNGFFLLVGQLLYFVAGCFEGEEEPLIVGEGWFCGHRPLIVAQKEVLSQKSAIKEVLSAE